MKEIDDYSSMKEIDDYPSVKCVVIVYDLEDKNNFIALSSFKTVFLSQRKYKDKAYKHIIRTAQQSSLFCHLKFAATSNLEQMKNVIPITTCGRTYNINYNYN